MINWDRAKTFSLWTVVILIAMSFGATVGMATNPSFSTVVQPGTMAVPVTQTVFTDGRSYFIRTGLTGEVSAGASAASALQTALTYIATHHGQMSIASGRYYLGTSNVSLLQTGSTQYNNFTIEFEAGAAWYYNGTTFALDLHATTRGQILQAHIVRPVIRSSTGGGIKLYGVYQSEIVTPFIKVQTVGIDVDNMNSVYIGPGGNVGKGGTVREANTVGIRIGNTGRTNQIIIDISTLLAWEHGIQVGNSAYSTQNSNIVIRDIDVSSNKVGVMDYTGQGVSLLNNWFEANTEADFEVNNTGGGTYHASGLTMRDNYFDANVEPAIYIPNGNYIDGPIAIGDNEFLGGVITFGNHVGAGYAVVNGAGTVTMSSTELKLIFEPNPQTGTVTGISTASGTTVTGTVNFPDAYPSGLVPKIQITLLSPSDVATVFGGIWVSSVSVTQFTWNVKVTTPGAGGSTVSLAWSSTL